MLGGIMKKRNVLALALALVMSVGMSSSVFAATWSGNAPKENDVEKVTYNFMNETKSGKYKLVDTKTLKNWVDKGDKMIIVDTMPAAASYNKQHVPGAINSVAPMTEKEYTSAEKADLMKQVKPLLSKKTVKKTTWTKVSKKTYKKLKKSNRKTKKSNEEGILLQEGCKEVRCCGQEHQDRSILRSYRLRSFSRCRCIPG